MTCLCICVGFKRGRSVYWFAVNCPLIRRLSFQLFELLPFAALNSSECIAIKSNFGLGYNFVEKFVVGHQQTVQNQIRRCKTLHVAVCLCICKTEYVCVCVCVSFIHCYYHSLKLQVVEN